MWVPILEKALAKLCGSYNRIVGGSCTEGLAYLTGYPTFRTKLQGDDPIDTDMLFALLASYMEADFLVCCGTGGCDITEAQYEAVGLMPAHAYSILAVELVQGGIFLVKLRNPWGHGEWNGDWSDASRLWTPQLKARLDVAEADDGIFYMALEDVRRYFSSLDVCRYVEEERREGGEPDCACVCVCVCVCVCMLCAVCGVIVVNGSFPFLLPYEAVGLMPAHACNEIRQK